jgi:hypothetical protein
MRKIGMLYAMQYALFFLSCLVLFFPRFVDLHTGFLFDVAHYIHQSAVGTKIRDIDLQRMGLSKSEKEIHVS